MHTALNSKHKRKHICPATQVSAKSEETSEAAHNIDDVQHIVAIIDNKEDIYTSQILSLIAQAFFL